MAAPQLAQPGVEVIQQIKSASPTIVTPTLVPFVCGPAFEVIDVVNADGSINQASLQGTYAQLPKTISQTAFPSPRGNILECVVNNETVKVFLLDSGKLRQLPVDPGSAFLTSWNFASSAAIQTLPITSGGLAIGQMTIVLAIDVTARLNTTKDIVIQFASATFGGTLTAAQIAAQINNAVGKTVATLIPVSGNNRVQITSPSVGAASSVTLRAGGSANTLLGFNPANEYRVEGSGFCGQDQQNNTTITPWIQFNQGAYVVTNSSNVTTSSTTFPSITSFTSGFGLVDNTGTFASSAMAALTFTGNGSINLMVGDQYYADGTPPNGAFVKKVEVSRFKLGTLDAVLSTFDSHGNVVNAVYDDSFVNTLFSAVPFAPNFAWFRAYNLNGNPAALPAVLTGVAVGAAATQGMITSGMVTVPASLSGLTLIFSVTVNGVVLADQTFTFSGPPFSTVSSIASAITSGVTGIVASASSGDLVIATILTGATQSVTLKAASTALAALNFTVGSDITGTGTDVTFANTNAFVKTAGNSFPLSSLATNTLVVKVSPDGGTTLTTKTHTFGSGPFNNIGAVVADIMTDATFIKDVTPSASGVELVLTTTTGSSGQVIGPTVPGHLRYIAVDPSSTGINAGGKLAFTGTETAVGADELVGHTFEFELDDRPQIYSVTFISDSLVDAVNSINLVVGYPVASIGGSGSEQLVLTSPLSGEASEINVIADGSTDSNTLSSIALGFGSNGATAVGSGRPNPDFSFDGFGDVVLGAEILRSLVTGDPLAPGNTSTYIQYKALRKDVSPLSVKTKPALLSIGDVTTLQNALNPVSTDNPLGLGMLFMLINAPNISCTAMGVDEVTAGAPNGTLIAYTRVAEFLESQEVYAIAPLTHDETVAQMFQAHVDLMSGSTQKGERILFFNPSVPTTAQPSIMGSGLNGASTSTPNQFVMDSNPAAALLAAGINTGLPIPFSANLYLEVTVATGGGSEVRVYNVSNVNGVLLVLNVTFTGTQNQDGFYTTTPLTETLVDASWTLAIRGAPLVIPGTAPPLPDKDAIAATVAAKAAAYGDRRLYYFFPDTCESSTTGLEQIMDGFYMCAAYAGLVAAQPPQQGFTNFPVAGFTGVVGSNDTFSRTQLNVMAAGGVFIIIQEVQGGPLTCRHQLSTNLTSIETRELSITKVVDFTAKFERLGLRNYIGKFNITQPFLDSLSTVIHAMGAFLVEQAVLIGMDLNNLIQDKTAPDTVLADETLDVPFPCNYIRLTLAI